MKVKSIEEFIPNPALLPDGRYTGVWGGSVITLFFKERSFRLTTEHGVRGFNIKVVVTIKNGEATFEQLDN